MLGIALGILRVDVLQSPSQAQADHGFFSAAASVCGVSEESAGLKPCATVSWSASGSRCGSEDDARSFSFSSAVASIAFMASMSGRGHTLLPTLSLYLS